jgi:ABC-type antimicrobial peptide transport system, ATPase component
MSTNTLQTQNVYKSYLQGDKTIPVLHDVSVTFEQGKTYAIIGASGSGKSTFLHILGGLDIPTSGTVLISNKNIATMSPSIKEKFLNASIGFVFQFHYLINELTVQENIMLMGLISNQKKSTCLKKTKELLEHFGIADKALSYPPQLSGGEQQRVAIIRALFNKPAFLLADEPTGNLDALNAEKTVQFLLQCQREWNMGLIICSHDKAIYEKMDKVLELKEGRLQ